MGQSCAKAPWIIGMDPRGAREVGVDFEEQSGWTRTGNLEDTYI